MQFRNFTPFEPMFFDSEGHRGLPFSVVVLKGRFSIEPGKPLTFLEPGKILLVDELREEPQVRQSSVVRESNLAPLKKSTDVLFVNPVAHSPHGVPTPSWDVRVKAGTIAKAFTVTGERYWKYGAFGWHITPPMPTTCVPMHYENALGGWWDDEGGGAVCKQNPVGKGFVDVHSLDIRESILAPQIEDPLDPIRRFCQPSVPQGLGPIARSWEPRLSSAGTYDDAWLDGRWPQIPDDFDFAHYNSAHPDLIAPEYFGGTELIEVSGFSPSGPLSFNLPGLRVYVLLRYADGEIAPLVPKLDTIEIDCNNQLCDLVWRTQVLQSRPVRVVEARLIPGSEWDHG